ncbi:MAG: aminotransferase class V-fold PLP-dependent enzyme [Trueperaceae bacterium]|nr:aminotransferase class V-fold PLP-dependent enzyme [Trueperaceae bacterium]
MSHDRDTRRFETLAVHVGADPDPATGAVTPPIHLSTTFEREPDGSYPHGYIYTRSDNPNRLALEQCLTTLESGAVAAAFASGSAASASVFRLLGPGDHVVVPDDLYHGIAKMLQQTLEPWGLQMSFVDLTDLDALRDALRPNTKLVWIETPSNPLLKITDVAAVADIAHQHGAIVACDNTWSPPRLQPVLSS